MGNNIFGWSYPPGAANDPYAPYNQTDEPIDLRDEKTLKGGYGRRQHGLNGKDADLDGGQIVIESAWWFEDHVHVEGHCYGVVCAPDTQAEEHPEHAETLQQMALAIVCDHTRYSGEWDGDYWVFSDHFSLRIPIPARIYDYVKHETQLKHVLRLTAIACYKHARPFEQKMTRMIREIDNLWNDLQIHLKEMGKE